MTEKRLCQYSLTGLDILVLSAIVNQGKKVILVGDNKFMVVDKDE